MAQTADHSPLPYDDPLHKTAFGSADASDLPPEFLARPDGIYLNSGAGAELLYDTGIPFLVRDRDLLRPLGRDFLRTRIARAARNSDHKSAAQIDANIRRDKKARPRNNLGDAERLKGRLKNQMRRADDIRRAAECLAHQPDIARMDHAQKVGYLSSRGVRREFVKGAREWDLQSFTRAWKPEIEPLMRDYIISNGWFVAGYSPA